MNCPSLLHVCTFNFWKILDYKQTIYFKRPQYFFQNSNMAAVRDVLTYWVEWLIMFSLLAIHLILTFLLPVNGCPK